ncbi:MAG: CvpA family protein [Longicatena sp.]
MNAVTLMNMVIVVLLVFFMFSGYRQGFLLKLLSIFSFFVLGFVTWYLSQPLSEMFSLYPKESIPQLGIASVENVLYNNLNRFTVFVILFVFLYVLLLLVRPAIKVLQNIPVISTINRLAGCLLGGLQALLILFLLSFVMRFPGWELGNTLVSQSYLRYCEPVSKLVFFYIDLNELDEALQSDKTFTQEEINRYYDWLLKQNVSEENAAQIVSMLRSE